MSVEYRGRTVQALQGSTLRTAMLQAGVTPHNGRATVINCRGLGTCGTCAVEVQGPVEPAQWTTQERLRLAFPPHAPPGNRRLRLACQVRLLPALLWLLWLVVMSMQAAAVCAQPVASLAALHHLAGACHPRQVACQGDLRVVKRSGFWGQGDQALPDLAPGTDGSGGSGGGSSSVTPLGQLEFVLDRRWRRGTAGGQQAE